MCGITGFIDLRRQTQAADGEARVRRMADRLRHRGPDDSGVWSDPALGVFFAHRRLSIVDLSPAGHQPMVSASSRYVCVYNGEIFNHQDIRAELQAAGKHDWRGHSDTEVMLSAFDLWGIEAALPRMAGQFAIAVWDRRDQALTLIRDRAGEKPLYWGRLDGRLVFASELVAVEGFAERGLALNDAALPLLMRYGYIPAPHSIYAGIEKLMPGTWLRLRVADGSIQTGAYWSARQSVLQGLDDPFQGDDRACTDELERLVSAAVKRQLEADVPVGAFLSGGVDSSTVVALAQKLSSSPVKTFSIGFDQDAFDESQHARAVASHLGTQHNELRVSAADALAVVPKLSEIYDEPFSDGSQIPTYLVAKMARPQVTVALTGDGGDELFSGYPRYDRAQALIRLGRSMPRSARGWAASAIKQVSAARWNRLASGLGRPQGTSTNRTLGDRLHRVADLLQADRPSVFRYFASSMPDVAALLPGVQESGTVYDTPAGWPAGIEDSQLFMWMDFMMYLPDDLLVKTDRASMAVSLETRVPLLDHHVIEFSHRIPQSMRVRDGSRKWLLKQVLYRHVPRQIVDRPKMGFSMPLAVWLRGPLRAWAESLLFPAGGQDEPIDVAELRRIWAEHQGGARDWHQAIWTILMLRDWRRNRSDARAASALAAA